MKYLKVKNLDKYQHYKDKEMIWIKWYISTTDREFDSLSASEKWCFVKIICIACKYQNKVEYDIDWLHSQIGYREKKKNIAHWIGQLENRKLIEFL